MVKVWNRTFMFIQIKDLSLWQFLLFVNKVKAINMPCCFFIFLSWSFCRAHRRGPGTPWRRLFGTAWDCGSSRLHRCCSTRCPLPRRRSCSPERWARCSWGSSFCQPCWSRCNSGPHPPSYWWSHSASRWRGRCSAHTRQWCRLDKNYLS